MSRAIAVRALAAVALAATAAANPADAVPKPQGWIGTVDDWTRGLGIAFCLFALVVMGVAWRRIGRSGVSGRVKELLILPLFVLPLIIVFFGFSYGLESSKTVASCGSCHVMDSYLADLRDPEGDSLAATHFKNRYIQEAHCYTCHADYGMFGTVRAKLDGVGHVVRNTTGAYTLPLKIARPYPNVRCLGCHGESQKFLRSEGHPEEDRPALFRGEVSCLDCHGPAHAGATREASR